MTTSKAYFAAVAGEWDELRAGFFTEGMRDAAIARAALSPTAVVADIGTGTGFVLQGVAGQVTRAVGFDESADMLAVARQNLAGYPHVELREAEGQQLPAADNSFDAVFANMYLHHAPDPAAAIAEMARILKPGGKLVITDLDSHDQTWMRQAMADRWLGFARDDVRRWYEAAGLTAVEVDCAEGSCDCSAPEGIDISLSVFVAVGQKDI
jgi:ubiquinone/menaquinone biosynthesis C-methylase UbiE